MDKQNAALVKKAIKGNQKAFEKLVKQESEKLYKTAFLYVRNKEDALDVVQDTVCKALVSVHQVKQPEFFSTWLTRILIRTAYDVLRRKNQLIIDDELADALPAEQGPDIEGRLDVKEAIAALRADYQSVIILFYYHDYPIQQISRTLEIPENTVKTQLRRAKLELKKILEGIEHVEQRAY
ncbi:sigma-70 family RNA polymerase sigma factor [Jeotgalibacillus haloalkalitolerans]|uniref:Sigma-70 family RNA polymerase sigma factor n=1 Tax=Jeotgalibacillus haloalkalitolerans TaxID=3104292 RepID=A0ABU5KHJ7_9BACL|nr:sigma-70 family RNA polymerase sigma factor [Jeotgalibacillus sp. HH7-29]MDZ5710693.1 sigma-70 family RNA polymerase sigma factor [Jeotgalibacillus sp. HH7-29]